MEHIEKDLEQATSATVKSWFIDDAQEDEEDVSIGEYDLTSSPNDFNILTIFSFISSGAVVIPGFQRNYVWDIKRASKLIESLIIGLPIPQVFLYEKGRNKFLLIDGQQRLMSIYYFKNGRFPRADARAALRTIFNNEGMIPEAVMADDTYFSKFNLQLGSTLPNQSNRFNRLNYSTLGDYQNIFDLRTIRNVIIKQNQPADDDSSIFELFNRLNTGGVNLKPQEIRTSLYHSGFYDMLYRINADSRTRKILELDVPDLHMKDIEILLRGFALLVDGAAYKPSMTRFLNQFSKKCQSLTQDRITYFEYLYDAFLNACTGLGEGAFAGKGLNRFSISTYESVFYAACAPAIAALNTDVPPIDHSRLELLKADQGFIEASRVDTASKDNVAKRLAVARKILGT
jgi:hypothetical protein